MGQVLTSFWSGVNSGVLWTGVGTGVLVSYVVTISRYFLLGIVSVVLELVPGNNPVVRGNWTTDFGKGGIRGNNERVKAYQFGHRVWGKITYLPPGQVARIYKFRGNLRQNILVATYEIRGRQTLDRGAFTLRLSNNRLNLNGMYAWTDDTSGNPAGDTYEWSKIP